MRRLITPRESDVLRSLCMGKTEKAIGQDLGITRHTVNMHFRNMHAKLGISNKVALAVWAVRNKVVE